MNFVKAGIRVKSDTASVTADFMRSEEREALNFIEVNIRDNNYTLDNQYVYDDYINSSLNRGALQREIDLIRRYYQIK
jgi:hypothetical protein